MSFQSDAAPVPVVDRALGASLTFVVTAFASVVGYVLLVDPAVDPSATRTLLGGLGADAFATVLLVYFDGYAALRVPVEGRRWTIELAVAALAFVAMQALVSLVPALTAAWVLLFLAVAYYGTVHVGDRAATELEWYDRDAYAWRRDPKPTDARTD